MAGTFWVPTQKTGYLLPMTLRASIGPVAHENVGPSRIQRLLRMLPEGSPLMFERLELDLDSFYLEVCRLPDCWELECRDGAATEHYRATTTDEEQVLAVVVAWSKGGPAWRELLVWEDLPLVLDAPLHPSSGPRDWTSRSDRLSRS